VIPSGRVLDLAFGAVRGVLSDPAVRRIFLIFGVAFLATQMARPYIPILVEHLVEPGAGLASAIALVTGTAALVGAVISPVGGWLGDRVGFRPVLIAALAGGGVALALMPAASSVPALALIGVALSGSSSVVSAMVFGLLAIDVPAERRSATLNLVYLPLYVAGILGPASGAVIVGLSGLAGPFLLGAAVYSLGALVVAATRRAAPR
jgi:MFS family permease